MIKKSRVDEAKLCDELLTMLIQDERKYNQNINPNFKVDGWYETKVNLDNNCLLLCEENNEIVGFLYGFIDDAIFIEKEAILDALFVKEEYRSKGIATSLIEEFKNWCKENKVKYLNVNVINENTQAFKLYQKNGFKVEASRLKTKL